MARKKYFAWPTLVLLALFVSLTACRLGGQRGGAGTEATVTAVAQQVLATLTAQAPVPTPTPPPPPPTDTPAPPTASATLSASPTATRVVPPTDTPVPAATDTPVPSPTDTPVSSPADTPPPPPSGERVHWTETTGRPNFAPNQDLGFFIWVEEPGIIHLRCVTRGMGRLFSGSIIGDGAIRNVVRTRQEWGDVTIHPDINRVDFRWTTAGGPDGLDFAFKGANLTFKLRLDGQPAPQVVYLGSTNRTIGSLPLTIYR